MNTPAHRRRLPNQIADAIAAILDYHWHDEARDYLSRPREQQGSHIFNDMMTVRQWLERGTQQTTPQQQRRRK